MIGCARAASYGAGFVFSFLVLLGRGTIIGDSIMTVPNPPITISSLDEVGVVLLPPSHPEFAAGLRPGRKAEFDVIMPYTAVIKNRSEREVIAYTVLWKLTGSDGQTLIQTRSVYNFSNLRAGANLPSSASDLVFTFSVESGRSWNAGVEADVTRLVDIYSRQKAIRIVLDAVLFNDGSAFGPNQSHSIEKWQAWLEAEEAVFTEATAASPAEVKDVLRRLAEPGLALQRKELGKESSDPGLFGVMVDRSSKPAEYLTLAKGYFALSMLREIDERGDSVVRNNILAVLRSKQYPKVHRKEQMQ